MTGPVEEVALSISSALERATEIGPLLLLAGFMLMLDCVSLKSYHVNILHLTQSPELVGPQLAIEAFLVLLAYGLLLILVVPIAAMALWRCCLCLRGAYCRMLGRPHLRHNRRHPRAAQGKRPIPE
jgi:hypothetical protein